MADIMPAKPSDTTSPTLFNQIFGLEKHEYRPVAWSFVYLFCVLSSYYVLRPVREAMAVGSGPNTIPWLFLGTFIATLVATSIFGWVASRYSRRQFLPWVYLFFICNILVFWLVFSIAIDREQSHIWLGRAFFVWLSVFNLFVVSVFWSFMADIYTREQGRRLFGVITAGGSIGALIGGVATSALVLNIGFQNLFPIAAALLTAAIFCIRQLREWVSSEQARAAPATVEMEKPLGGGAFSGVTHLMSSPYFGGIALSSIIASLLGTALYMITAELVQQSIGDPDLRTQFFSNINNWTNAIALVLQLLWVKRVVSRFGIGVSLALMPIVSIAGFAMLAVNPTLATVAILTIARRGLGFGFGKPTTDMLYSVVTPEEKYKTKNVIDTAVYRFGDLVGTFSVRGLTALGMGISALSWVMLPVTTIWAIVALWLGRDYRRRAALGYGNRDNSTKGSAD